MGEYTYLVGLVVFGVILFTAGMIAAGRERRAHRRDGGSAPQVPAG
jgi:hypothetical protein